MIADTRAALRFKLSHDDITKYNAVQRALYIGIILVMIVQVISGLAIWKPVQFQELTALFYDFQGARLAHFICMALIVGFLVVHVALALLVPKTHRRDDHRRPRGRRRAPAAARFRRMTMAIRTPSPSIFRPQQRDRPERAGREPQADRGDRPPQNSARRRQPRRADDAHRLQRHRPQRGAERAARGVGMERRRAGVPVQSQQARADLYARRRCCGRRATTPITRSRR